MPGTSLFPATFASEPLGFSHPARPEPSFPTTSFSAVSQTIQRITNAHRTTPCRCCATAPRALQMSPCAHVDRCVLSCMLVPSKRELSGSSAVSRTLAPSPETVRPTRAN
jgi:hypothetical protein